jgi:hypothetical protein
MAGADSGIEDPEDDYGYREETHEDCDDEGVAEDVAGSWTLATEDAGRPGTYSSQDSK